MSIQYFALLLLILCIELESSNTGYHYHRYMLSDYRPQHTNKTQMDYKRVPRPKYPEETPKLRSGKAPEPTIKMLGNTTSVKLSKLLVRIYHDNSFLCMGTLLTEQTILTAATCFKDPQQRNFTIKTFKNQVIGLFEMSKDVEALVGKDSLVTMLSLTKAVPTSNNNTAQLCLAGLKADMKVELPTYIRSRHAVHNQVTKILPLAVCRQKLNDVEGNIVTESMICVQNKKHTTSCQHTHGNPLIHNGQICGINVMGHNCPKKSGVDLYAIVINDAQIQKSQLMTVINGQVEEFLV